MPLNIPKKTKPLAEAVQETFQPKPTAVVSLGTDEAIIPSAYYKEIDAVGALQAEADDIEAQIKALKAQLKPYEKAMAALQEKIDADEMITDDEDCVVYGQNFQVEVGKRKTVREVTDLEKVHEIVGTEVFLQMVSVTLKDTEKYLTGEQVAEVVTAKRGKHAVGDVKKRTDV